MGGNALLAGILCQTLPETKDLPTAETMETESTEEAYMALKSAVDYKEKEDADGKQLTMADNVKDTTNSRANLVDYATSLWLSCHLWSFFSPISPKYFFWFSFKLWQVLVLDLNVLTKAESVEVILQYCTAYAVLRNKRAHS